MTLRTLLLVVAMMLATAAPALAHVKIVASNPEPGQALDKPPPSVRLTLSEPLKAQPTVTVTDPNGTQWSMGRPTMDNLVLTVPADSPYGPAGKYTVNYRVTGQDGHLVTGDIVFDITTSFGQPLAAQQQQPQQPPQPQPPQPQTGHDHTAQSKQDEGGVPIGLWIFGIAVLLGAALFVVIRLRRKGDKPAL
jgi:copper resistance protein C